MKHNLLFFILIITLSNQAHAFITIFEVNVECATQANAPKKWQSKVEFIPFIKKNCTFYYTGAADVTKSLAAQAINNQISYLKVSPANKANMEFEYKIVNLENNESIKTAEKDGGWKAVGNKFKLNNYKNCYVLVRSSSNAEEIRAAAKSIILAVSPSIQDFIL